ncbi:hypothetical protein [Collimonas antrihumi]|nr:hypothetical protein [Collimonas antrihumi]
MATAIAEEIGADRMAILNDANRNAFFGGTAQDYTDYPTMREAEAA